MNAVCGLFASPGSDRATTRSYGCWRDGQRTVWNVEKEEWKLSDMLDVRRVPDRDHLRTFDIGKKVAHVFVNRLWCPMRHWIHRHTGAAFT